MNLVEQVSQCPCEYFHPDNSLPPIPSPYLPPPRPSTRVVRTP